MSQAIIALAAILRLRTVAEGVEHAHQAEQLVRMGCDAAQGFLYAPAPDAGGAAESVGLPVPGPGVETDLAS